MTKDEGIKCIVAIINEVRKEAWQAGYDFARLMENKQAPIPKPEVDLILPMLPKARRREQ